MWTNGTIMVLEYTYLFGGNVRFGIDKRCNNRDEYKILYVLFKK